jgi:putative transposase
MRGRGGCSDRLAVIRHVMAANVWPLATVQTCAIHLIRNTVRLASKRDWNAIKRAIGPIYTAVNAAAAAVALDDLDA